MKIITQTRASLEEDPYITIFVEDEEYVIYPNGRIVNIRGMDIDIPRWLDDIVDYILTYVKRKKIEESTEETLMPTVSDYWHTRKKRTPSHNNIANFLRWAEISNLRENVYATTRSGINGIYLSIYTSDEEEYNLYESGEIINVRGSIYDKPPDFLFQVKFFVEGYMKKKFKKEREVRNDV